MEPTTSAHRWTRSALWLTARGTRSSHTDLAAVNAFFVRSDLGGRTPCPRRTRSRAGHQPNYFMQGYRHPADPEHRPYTDLAADESSGSGER